MKNAGTEPFRLWSSRASPCYQHSLLSSSTPKDFFISLLGTALAGNADVVCTRDADFFPEEVQRFSAAHGIQILTDLELLRSLRQ